MTRSITVYENDRIILCEDSGFCSDRNCEYCESVCHEQDFAQIKTLCDKNLLDGVKIFRENGHDVVKCSGYTGYFQLDNGTEVLILPKIHKDKLKSEQVFKNLICTALKIKNIKIASDSDTDLNRKDLFREVLIKIFCSIMETLFKKGIKKFYSPREENLPYLKGKIKFSEHIKRNITSREKFYVEYDEFTDDISENRILKAACECLIPKTGEEQNKKYLRRFLFEFADIEKSKNLDKDFAKIQNNRLFNHYEQPLRFAEVFLHNKSFNPVHGNKKFPALLFSLHDLFEDYIQNLLEYYKAKYSYKLRVQYSPYRLLSKDIPYNPSLFKTQMDFVVWNVNKTKVIIMDAKYKLINLKDDVEESKYNSEEEKDEEKTYYNNTNISQHDLYQVFSYSQLIKQYEPKVKEVEIALLYPKTDSFEEKRSFYYFNGIKLTFIPIDLTGNGDEIYDNNNILKKFIVESLNLSE